MPVRLICANTHPDHDTICTFRKRNEHLLRSSFSQVLQMAVSCGFVKVGNITEAIDGAKFLANASKHAAVSYGWSLERMEQLDNEIEQLMKKAEEADSTPLDDGLSIPEEIERREQRKAQEEIRARAKLRAELEKAESLVRCSNPQSHQLSANANLL